MINKKRKFWARWGLTLHVLPSCCFTTTLIRRNLLDGRVNYYAPESIYRLCDTVVKDCDVRQMTTPAPPRARCPGARTMNFSDVVLEHTWSKDNASKPSHSLAKQSRDSSEVTRDNMRTSFMMLPHILLEPRQHFVILSESVAGPGTQPLRPVEKNLLSEWLLLSCFGCQDWLSLTCLLLTLSCRLVVSKLFLLTVVSELLLLSICCR